QGRPVRRPVAQGVRAAGRAAEGGRRRGLRRAAAGTGLGREHRPVHQRRTGDPDEAAAQARRPAGDRDRAGSGVPDPMRRLTIRFRVPLLYGGLFLLAGAWLVTITYLLLAQRLATTPPGNIIAGKVGRVADGSGSPGSVSPLVRLTDGRLITFEQLPAALAA